MAAAGVVVGAVLCTVPAAAARPTVSVSPSTVMAGDMVVVRGSVPMAQTQCPPGSAVNLTSDPAVFSSDGLGPAVTVDASCRFRVRLRVPATTEPGVYVISFRYGGGNIGVGANLRVNRRSGGTSQSTAASAGASGPVSLAVTGDRPALVATAGVVLVVLGGAAAVLGRRRRTRFVADE